MSINKLILWFIVVVILAVVVLSLRPMPEANLGNCSNYKGTIADVKNGAGEGDIVFELENDKNSYYINRGIDAGLKIDLLKSTLVGRQADILAIRHWTPLDPLSRNKHIASLTCNGSLIYSEFKKNY